jgi:hypothetical protein
MRDSDRNESDLAPDERDDAFAERIAAPLRAGERPDPLLASRVVTTIRASGRAGGASSPVVVLADRPSARPAARSALDERRAWWQHKLTIGVAPLAGLLAAASLVVAVVVSGKKSSVDSARATGGRIAASPAPPVRVDTVQLVRFVFVAKDARSVSLVGDFNEWDRTAVRLVRSGTGGVWSATVRLPAGRHEYAFLVDGQRWVADPNAPSSIQDEFGVESSVVTVDPSRTTSTSRT